MEHDIGTFLRSRRARIQPEEVGLPDFGRRRVPGLRREELAQLASVSVDYYVRLEQGRGANVSDEILDAVARALGLSDVERHHLRLLAHPVPARGDADEEQMVTPHLRMLLDSMHNIPAFVYGRRTDVLAANALGNAVIPYEALPAERRNCAWYTFMDPAAAELFPEWEAVAAQTVAFLALDAGRHPGDRRLESLIGELSIASAPFRRLWARHDVLDQSRAPKLIRHPIAGELHFTYQSFNLPDDPDQLLVTFTVQPGSSSDERLRMLASWGDAAET